MRKRRYAAAAVIAHVAIALGLLLCGCSASKPTQIVVVVHAESQLLPLIDTLQITALLLGAGDAVDTRAPRFDRAYELSTIELPASVALAAGAYADRRLLVTAAGLKGSQLVVARRARLSWVRDRVKVLSLELVRACAERSTPCPGQQTCAQAGCIPLDIDASRLPDYPGGLDGSMSPASDGGAGEVGDSGDADLGASDGPPPDARPDPIETGFCSEDNWCWLNPLPHGNDLHAITAWGTGETAWLFGQNGTIARIDGQTWTNESLSGDASGHSGAWGSGPTDIYAVGGWGNIVQRGTQGWLKQQPTVSRALYDVWGDDTIYAVGQAGTILTSADGQTWTDGHYATTTALLAIWGPSGGNPWSVGHGLILQLHSGSWSDVTPDAALSAPLTDVWGVDDEVFAVSSFGEIFQRKRATWTVSKPSPTQGLHAVWGRSSTDVFVAGAQGVIRHFDGSSWTAEASGTSVTLDALGGGSGRVYAAGVGGEVRVTNGGPWQPLSASITRDDLHAVWGTPSGHAFAVGRQTTILLYDGSRWRRHLRLGGGASLRGVWASAHDNAIAVGDQGTILHYDGSQWQPKASGTTRDLHAVWGDSNSAVFAVGETGTILRYDGHIWADDASPIAGEPIALLGVWGRSSEDVFAVGETGTILHRAGTTWTQMASPVTTPALRGVGGPATGSVVAAGDDGTIVRYDGSWVVQNRGVTKDDLQGVWATSGSSEIFVYGQRGGLFVNDGVAAWNAVITRASGQFNGMWGGDTLHLVGDKGTILVRPAPPR